MGELGQWDRAGREVMVGQGVCVYVWSQGPELGGVQFEVLSLEGRELSLCSAQSESGSPLWG